jgi:hypothetical protein
MDARIARRTQKARIDAAMEALSLILREGVTDREAARRILSEVYQKHAVQPIRGKAWPPDIWDKEMATLYVLAKYAFALNEENPELFNKIFSFEETLEEAASLLLEKPPSEARRFFLFLLGGDIDDNTVARLLRVESTKVLLGFGDEDRFIKLLKKLSKVVPEQERTVRKYARYYIATRLAQAIAAGIVRNRIAKEAYKQALAARIGFDKTMPDDEYVGYIALNVFGVPKKRVERVLGGKNTVSDKREKGKKGGTKSAAGS